MKCVYLSPVHRKAQTEDRGSYKRAEEVRQRTQPLRKKKHRLSIRQCTHVVQISRSVGNFLKPRQRCKTEDLYHDDTCRETHT